MSFKRIACALVPLLYSVTVSAQTDWSEIQIHSEHIAGQVYMLRGRGGNIGVFVGSDGVFMVDDQFAPLTDKIVAAVRELSDGEIRFLINTHIHPDHTGGNENFGKAGVPIVAHDNVRSRLAEGLIDRRNGERQPPAPDDALPILTFVDSVSFHLNGEQVDVLSVPAAHTDGDVFIHFRGSNVLHLGDVFRTNTYPYIDRNHGGSFQGSIDALNIALELAGPETRVIPGHGGASDREGVKRYRDLMVTIRDRVQAMIDEGKSVEEVMAARPTAEFDERWLGTGWNTLEVILTGLYDELKDD